MSTATRIQRREVRTARTIKVVHRDEQKRIAYVTEFAWQGQDGLVPVAAAAAMAEEAVRAAAPQIEIAASAGIDAWLDRHALALPPPLDGQLAADYFAEVRDAILDGRIDAEVFVLPLAFTDDSTR